MEVSARPVGHWSERLALRVLLHVTLGDIECLGLVIPLVDAFVGERASSLMVPIVAIVDFLHFLSFD